MLTGCFTALITPFRNGTLDPIAVRRLVHFQLEHKIDGLVVAGTTGEVSTLEEDEFRQLLDIVVHEVAGQVPVIAGAGSNNPREAAHYAHIARELGADAILAVAGYYNRPSQEGLFRHFEYLHTHSDIPIIVYNIPPRTIVDIQPETLARIAELPRVIGIKDSCGDLGRICHERQRITKPFSFLSGDDITALAYNAHGGNGCISVASNVLPGYCRQLQERCREGDFRTALAMHDQMIPFYTSLFREPNPAGVKYAASLLGLCTDECRLPLVPLSDATKSAIGSSLAARA
jgi:4-hydroxy-tetrahydrodipicolinate synthase